VINKSKPENASDITFQLLSIASLLSKINNGLSIEELYDYAERKFDILMGLLNNEYSDESLLVSDRYSLDDLKQLSLSIFQKLIFNPASNPFMTICVSESASLDEVKRRRNKLLHIFHPDRNIEGKVNGKITVHHPDRNIEGKVNGKITVQINNAFEQIIHNRSEANISNKRRTNIPSNYANHYSHQKKSYEKKFYLFLVIFVTILALISLLKVISIF
jgi:hypothetical protein